MNKQRIVVNTIAFAEPVGRGAKQLDFFQLLAGLGVQHIEVREEYFGSTEELADTGREAARLGIDLLYSVPKPLFRNGRLDLDMVTRALLEAKALSARAIKWTRGDFRGWAEPEMHFVQNSAEQFEGLFTVENDQTQRDGTLPDYLEFLEQCRDASIPIYATFDIGNWIWVGQDPLVSARQLHPFVRYIHCKDVVLRDTGPEAVPAGQGSLALTQVFSALPQDTLIALEYPCGDNPLPLIQTGIDWLTAR